MNCTIHRELPASTFASAPTTNSRGLRTRNNPEIPALNSTERDTPRTLTTNTIDPITDENKLQSERLTLDGVDERLYRTRRQPYSIGDYDDDAIESIKNALDEEKSKELVEAKELTVDAIPVDELEFLVNDKLGDRYSDQKQPRDDFDTEYEKAFSRKYKHPRKFSELAERNEFLLGSVKRNSKNDDYGNEDYEDVGGDDELPQGDAPSLENAVYTEGGMVQPSNDRSGGDAEGIL